jgi:hypothetical protein
MHLTRLWEDSLILPIADTLATASCRGPDALPHPRGGGERFDVGSARVGVEQAVWVVVLRPAIEAVISACGRDNDAVRSFDRRCDDRAGDWLLRAAAVTDERRLGHPSTTVGRRSQRIESPRTGSALAGLSGGGVGVEQPSDVGGSVGDVSDVDKPELSAVGREVAL